jgi:cytochrome P450
METFGVTTREASGDGMTSTDNGLYYDPYDFEVDKDPYPIWKRLRDERPLYYNEKYGFYALSRFDDVEGCSKDWRRYSSARGTLLEMIKGGMKIPPGSIIFEDPPEHDVHRALLVDVFKPRRIAALEPKVREFCARSLEPLVAKGGFDFVADLGAPVPMRTIGMLLGIPDEDQQAIRERIDDSLKLREGAPTGEVMAQAAKKQHEVFAAYIDWRAKNPSDDIMTELLTAEFDDVDGKRRRLSREEVLGYVNLLAAAGNETTTRLIGWAGKVLAEHPEQRRELAKDPRLIPGAIEELLRYESPSPVQARYVTEDVKHHGQPVKAGSVMLLLTGSANRDERRFPNGDRFDVHRAIERHVAFGYGVHFCLGAALARLEARIALEEVLKRFTDWEVDWAHALQAHTSTVRGWERLPVITR